MRWPAATEETTMSASAHAIVGLRPQAEKSAELASGPHTKAAFTMVSRRLVALDTCSGLHRLGTREK